ncbi:ABC transporter permease [Nocardioides anomalus]|uniref:ABC transporter permease n=1 Tax=Nocardioides anomalus TaxID=2712223 RepID=A0A6G6WGT9_9ACTN|nr:ABC transporter permease [Nocardioides anomalus]QIG44373.1 ABC transporter permease [Nocardioides anomalus]
MTRLALASLRHRSTASLATFLTVLLGTALMGSFTTMVATATGDVSSTDRESLLTIGAVVGGWGTLIVLFAVVSTVGITVTQREDEVRLLRTVGATPRQTKRLVRAETGAVALVAAALGAALAYAGGAGLLALLRGSGLVGADVTYAPAYAPVATGVLLVLVALLGSGIAARRQGRTRRERLPWWRVAAGVALIGYGVAMAVVTVTVTAHDADPYAAMQTSGSCSILVGLGLAALAPWLLRHLAVVARPALGRSGAGHLAAHNTRRRAHLLSGVLAPVIVLTSAAVGTLMLVSVDGRTLPAGGFDQDTADAVNLLNDVVVGMIVLFAAVVVVNSFAEVVAHRRAELHRLWLLGATPGQVERSVLAEAGVVAAVGVLLGLVASLATVVPFAVARHEGVVPDGGLWLPPVVVAGVVALTLLAARSAVRRTAVASLTTGAPR